MKIQLSKV